MVCFLMGGVSPLLGFGPSWFYEEVTPPDSFTHDLSVPPVESQTNDPLAFMFMTVTIQGSLK